jgi:hypothetical protein
LKVFLALSTVGGRGTVLNEISIDRDSVLIKGESPSLSDVQRFTGDLEGLFSDVTISDTKPSLQNRTTLFTVTAREKAE